MSVRFANGGLGEIILVEETINDAKFNRGGHLLYDVTRELAPYRVENEKALAAYKALDDLSALVYQTDSVVAPELFARAKSVASSALDALKPELKKLSLSSLVATAVKSSDALLKKAKPASVSSAAMPSRSLIQNISNTILTDSVGLSTIISL